MRKTSFDLGRAFVLTVLTAAVPIIAGIVNVGVVIDFVVGVDTYFHLIPTVLFFTGCAAILYYSRSQLIPLLASLYFWCCELHHAYYVREYLAGAQWTNQADMSAYDTWLTPIYGICVFFKSINGRFYNICLIICGVYITACIVLISRWFILYAGECKRGQARLPFTRKRTYVRADKIFRLTSHSPDSENHGDAGADGSADINSIDNINESETNIDAEADCGREQKENE